MSPTFSLFFFFNDTATPEIYTLSLHDALPISRGAQLRAVRGRMRGRQRRHCGGAGRAGHPERAAAGFPPPSRSEEHTSELQSQSNLVCRLLLEKKKKTQSEQLTVSIHSAHELT